MKKIINWIKLFLGAALLLLFLIIFYLNKDAVFSFNYIVGTAENFKLIYLMVIIFICGAITAFIVTILSNARKVINVIKLRSQVRQLTSELEQEKRKKPIL